MLSVAKKDKENFKKIDKVIKNNKDNLIRIRNYIEKNFEFVGEKFSEKAREVFYDKKSKKGKIKYLTPPPFGNPASGWKHRWSKYARRCGLSFKTWRGRGD